MDHTVIDAGDHRLSMGADQRRVGGWPLSLGPVDSARPTKDRCRRILVIAGCPGEGRFTTPKPDGAEIKNSETDDFGGCIGTVRVLFMG
jgi:hypothetical protein